MEVVMAVSIIGFFALLAAAGAIGLLAGALLLGYFRFTHQPSDLALGLVLACIDGGVLYATMAVAPFRLAYVG
jgi:hypothetical protein